MSCLYDLALFPPPDVHVVVRPGMCRRPLPDRSLSSHCPYTVSPPSPPEAHGVVRPGMRRLFAKEPDRVVVPELDLCNLEVICRVIGQSAALDFYTR